MPVSQILLNNFFQGGLADSQYAGNPNSLAEIVGLDLHSEPGILKVSQALVKESGSNIDDVVSQIVVCSDGKGYLFQKTNGKIFSRTTAGVYNLEATNTAASPGILDAAEYNGYVYYSAASKLGRWQKGTAWSARNDAFATFTNGNTLYHPMYVKNGVLYIGDGFLVAQVDDSTGSAIFSPNALDIPTQYIVQCLGEVENDLLVGATTNTILVDTQIFRWNTYSVSFTNNDSVPEIGINAFLPLDNVTVVQAGQRGNIYTYNGAQLEQFKRILGDWSNQNKAFVQANAIANYMGRALFGLSNNMNNPVNQGVYSFGGFSANYPKVLALEFILSTLNLNNIQISAIAIMGDDILVAWKDTNAGTVYGVDKVDWSNKYTAAYFTTRVLAIDRSNGKQFAVHLGYRQRPASCPLTLQASINGGAFSSLTLTEDVDRHFYYTKERLPTACTLRLKVGFTVNGNNAPDLESVLLDFP